MRYLAVQLSDRVKARVGLAVGPDGPPSPRTVIDAILTEALPTDEDSRVFNIVYASYAALSLTDPAFAIKTLVQASDVVENVITEQLARAQQAGQMPAGLDPGAEAATLLAMSAGLATSVLGGQRSADDAMGVIRYQIDRLLPAEKS
jgi:hypothetical protein